MLLLVDNGTVTSLQKELLQMYRKYDEVLAIVTQSHQYAILMASHCMKAMDSYEELSSRVRVLEVSVS